MKLRFFIFITASALGIIPILTLVAINLRGHISRHEQVSRQAVEETNRLKYRNILQLLSHHNSNLHHISTLPEVNRFFECREKENIPCNGPESNLTALYTSWLAGEYDVAGLQLTDSRGKSIMLTAGKVIDTREKILTSALKTDVFSRQANEIKKQSGLTLHIHTRPPENEPSLPAQTLTMTASVHNVGQTSPGYATLWLDISKLLHGFDQIYLVDLSDKISLSPLLSSPAGNKYPEPTQSDFDSLLSRGNLVSQRINKRDIFTFHSDSYLSISFMPLYAAGSNNTVLLASVTDRSSAQQWKQALIYNILLIVCSMMVIVFFIANFISKRQVIIKDRILEGLNRTLENEEEVVFNWPGPQELQVLAGELTDISRKYCHASKARREAEKDLAESENKFRNLAASAQDAIILIDSKGRITFWNEAAEEIFGYHSREALGKAVYELISPRLAQNEFNINLILDNKSGPIKETLELTAADNKNARFPIELSLSEAKIKDEYHSIWIIRNISARKNAEEQARLQQQQLVQADKMISLGLLVSGMAHEINNPNSIVMLNAPMLARAWQSITPILDQYYEQNGDFSVAGLDYSEMREQIPLLFSELEDSSRRIKHIVQDLKDYARKDTTKHMELINLNDIVKAAIRLTYNQLKRTTRFFEAEYDETIPPIRGNHQRLEQVIINLLQNSYEALDSDEAAIKIATRHNREMKTADIVVSDQGCGMAPDVITKITDPFFTTKRKLGGTGLGLSVSAGIIKEHNGILAFASQPGEGTTATISLPIPTDNP